jgi:hypothetical protein
VSIAAGIATAGMGSLLVMGIASAAIGLVDDVVLAGVDVTQGYKSAGEVGVDLGKKVVTAAASVGVNAVFNGVGKFVETVDAGGNIKRVVEAGGISKLLAGKLGDGFGQVALNAGLAGAKTLTTSTISSAVNAITYSEKDGFGYSSEAFKTGVTSGLVSSAAAMASSFTTGALGQIDLFDGLNRPIEEHNMFAYETRKFNNLIGGLAGQGVNYALGEDFTLNLVNLGDFTNNKIDMGLLEIHLGLGEEIFRGFKLGSDGVNVNFNTLKYAVAGAANFTKVVGAKLSNLIGSGERLSVLTGINTMAYSNVKEERDFAAELLGRDLKSVYEDLINKGIVEKDKAGSIVGNKDDNPKNMVTVLAELMNKKNDEILQQEIADQPDPPSNGIGGIVGKVVPHILNNGENIKRAFDALIIASGMLGNNEEVKNAVGNFFGYLKTGFGSFYDEFETVNTLFQNQPPIADANSDNGFPLWNKNTQKNDTLFTLANGIEFGSVNNISLAMATGTNATINGFNIKMSDIIQGFKLGLSKTIATEGVSVVISGGAGYFWNNEFTATAGLSFSIPLNRGKLDIFNNVEINNKGKSTYNSGLRWIF